MKEIQSIPSRVWSIASFGHVQRIKSLNDSLLLQILGYLHITQSHLNQPLTLAPLLSANSLTAERNGAKVGV